MPVTGVEAIELYWESFGDPSDPALLLISGLGAQCTGFDDRLVADLVALGLRVFRFDNRDVGLSTHVPVDASYSVADMAADAIRLVEALDIGPLHVLGVSMGGMIAQQVAIDRPDLVLTMTLVMTTTGSRDVGQPAPELLAGLLEVSQPAEGPDEAVDRGIALARLIGSPDFDEEYHRRRQESFVARAHDPAGVGRQMVAIVASPSREDGLRALHVPTVVIHGSADRLVDPSGGRRLAEVIPGARHVEIAEMGHDLPPRVWPEVVAEVAALTQSVSKRS